MANPVNETIINYLPDAATTDLNTPQATDSMLFTGATALDGNLRDLKSVVRQESLNKQWERWKGQYGTLTYVSATSFTLSGDQRTSNGGPVELGRRIKATVTAGTVYGSISSVAYAVLTTVGVTLDSGSLDAGLSEVQFGIPTVLNSALPGSGGVAGAGPPILLTNKSAVTLSPGDVVAFVPGTNPVAGYPTDQAVVLWDVAWAIVEYAVAIQTIASGAQGYFVRSGLAYVNITGNVAVGDYIRKSVTTKTGAAANTSGSWTGASPNPVLGLPSGAFAVAVQATAGGLTLCYLFGVTANTGVVSTNLAARSSAASVAEQVLFTDSAAVGSVFPVGRGYELYLAGTFTAPSANKRVKVYAQGASSGLVFDSGNMNVGTLNWDLTLRLLLQSGTTVCRALGLFSVGTSGSLTAGSNVYNALPTMPLTGLGISDQFSVQCVSANGAAGDIVLNCYKLKRLD